MKVTAIVAAGGRGARFGADRPKQLLTLGGRPILQHSVETFLRCGRVDDVVVALPVEVVAEPPAYLTHARVQIVAGGRRRQDSVANAFAVAAPRADIVVVHDAARPFVTDALIGRTVDAAGQFGAAIAAIPAHDTVKRGSAERFIVETVPRDTMFLAQTPQAFRTGVLQQALASADAGDATDEATLVERAGHPVKLVEGDARNIKITTPEDLVMAERKIGRAHV